MGAGQARLGLIALLAAGLALAGCGDDEPDAVDGEDAAEIAGTINAVREGLVTGDGEAVCGSLLEQGQRITIKLASQFGPAASSCEEAVAALAASLSESERERFLGPREYRAADVDIDPTDDPGFNETTDEAPEGGPEAIQVPCVEGDGNAWFAQREDDGSWKLSVPFCSGR